MGINGDRSVVDEVAAPSIVSVWNELKRIENKAAAEDTQKPIQGIADGWSDYGYIVDRIADGKMTDISRPFQTFFALSTSGITFSFSCLSGDPIARPIATSYGYSNPPTQCIVDFSHV